MVVEQHKGYAIVRPSTKFISKQGLTNFLGLSGENVGAKGLCMNIVVIPPGKSAEPHCHESETAIYVMQGTIVTRFGEGLQEEAETCEGSFLYIGPYTWHQPVNRSDREAVAIIARNDPNEQEHVIPYTGREKSTVGQP
ncbi:MAG: cupin domain-containing protein [Chloroflexi bacterium]|nr:cupin domain-containing protein [Chloroflexota bacterium]MCL5109159.1 cupin domain-containing protein [Chloroflexota bacterium]